MCCCMVTAVRHVAHSELNTICASHPHVELAKQVLFSQRGLFLRTLEYHSRLVVDSVSIKCLKCVMRKIDFPFLAKSTQSFIVQ